MWNPGSSSGVDPAITMLDAKQPEDLGNVLLTGAEVDELHQIVAAKRGNQSDSVEK